MGSGGGGGGGLNLAATAVNLQGNQKRRTAEKRALMRRAAQLRNQAAETRRVTGLQVDAFKKKAKVQMGENISAFAKAGVDISQSPLLIITQNSVEAGRQGNEIRVQGERDARLIEQGALNALSQKRDIDNAAFGEDFGTLLGGAAAVANSAPRGS